MVKDGKTYELDVEQPSKLQAVSPDIYAQMIRFMQANRGHGDDPKVGIFWFDTTYKRLYGVVSHPVRDCLGDAFLPDAISCSESHEEVWRKESKRKWHYDNWENPFVGSCEDKPKGRVYYMTLDEEYVVAVGEWINEYPEARELILEEFNLPADKTTFEWR